MNGVKFHACTSSGFVGIKTHADRIALYSRDTHLKFSDGGHIAEFLAFWGQDSKLLILIWSNDKLFQPFEIVVIYKKMGHPPNSE